MNILHITTHLNKGGITSYLHNLCNGLINRGHRLVVATSQGDEIIEFLKDKIEVLRIPLKTKSEISPKLLFSYHILKNFIKRNNIDLIHSHTRVAQVLGSYLSRNLKIPFLTTCHGFFEPRWHRKKFPCWGQKTIAISSAVKRHLINEFKVKEENIHIIHNGIELDKFRHCSNNNRRTYKKANGIPENNFVVGSVARFSSVKGLEYFLKAALQILEIRPKTSFLLVGSGQKEPSLKALVRDLNIESNVIFLSPQQSNVWEYLCLMDVFVMPSIQEGLGISILEAQAQKIPVVASNIGGIPDIIEDKVTGLLVAPKDYLAISQSVLALMQDKSLYNSIKDKAYDKVVNEFNIEQMVAKTEEVYRQLLCR